MAWTAPRTWVTGELVTAALFNTHVRDNQLYIKDILDEASLASNYTGNGSATRQITVGFKISKVIIIIANGTQIYEVIPGVSLQVTVGAHTVVTSNVYPHASDGFVVGAGGSADMANLNTNVYYYHAILES